MRETSRKPRDAPLREGLREHRICCDFPRNFDQSTRGVIVHAGDIGAPQVIEDLRSIAPTTAIRGNVDTGEWARAYPDTTLLRLAGRAVYVVHDLKALQFDPAASGMNVLISGHLHRPKIESRNGVLYLNPGSAGPRRFALPIAMATVEFADDAALPHIHEIAP